jgi:hypothetical protein
MVPFAGSLVAALMRELIQVERMIAREEPPA